MTRGEPDPEVIRRHLAALREALSNLRRHAERPGDLEEFAVCVEAHLARA